MPFNQDLVWQLPQFVGQQTQEFFTVLVWVAVSKIEKRAAGGFEQFASLQE